MSASLTQNLPLPSVPLINVETGEIDISWYRFFHALWTRTGGAAPAGVGVPGGANGNIQFNSAGAFGGLTDVQVTARIQDFTAVLSGAVPASGGGTTNFLRADGTFQTPPAAGAAGGDLSGTYPNPTVAKINGVALGATTATAGNLLIGSGTQWVTHAASGDWTITSAGVATVAKVNGVAYPAAPSTNTVPVVTGANTITYEMLPVAAGGTALASGTSGGILGYTAAGVLASSVALTQHALVVGGGAGATPTPVASLGTSTTVLHGAAAGDPTWSAVSLTADVTGTLPVANGGTGAITSTGSGAVVLATAPTLAGLTVDGNGLFHLTSQTTDAGALTATLTNAPTAGNPAFWVRVSVNGTALTFPAWTA